MISPKSIGGILGSERSQMFSSFGNP